MSSTFSAAICVLTGFVVSLSGSGTGLFAASRALAIEDKVVRWTSWQAGRLAVAVGKEARCRLRITHAIRPNRYLVGLSFHALVGAWTITGLLKCISKLLGPTGRGTSNTHETYMEEVRLC